MGDGRSDSIAPRARDQTDWECDRAESAKYEHEVRARCGDAAGREYVAAEFTTCSNFIAHGSDILTLRPGEVIGTGTPAGVGSARTPPIYLKDGDRSVCTYADVGTLTNPESAHQSRRSPRNSVLPPTQLRPVAGGAGTIIMIVGKRAG